ncbi:MAG: hypothetical protein ABII90_06830 [Bacteroidota bacterium]
MKKSKILGLFLVTLFLSSVALFEGCKKGEEDPGISFRGRDSRVTGTWTLKSYEINGTTSEIVNVSNDVNDDTFYSKETSTSSMKYNGTSMVTSDIYNYEDSDVHLAYDYGDTKWKDYEAVSDNASTSNSTTAYSLTLTLYKDNTYEITVTTGNASGSSTWEWSYDITDDANGDSDDSDDGDDDWSTTETSTSIEQGAWYWEDETKKEKLFLNAGPIKGKVVKLSNKELWIEIRYGALSDNNGEETSDLGSSTDVETLDLLKYDDDSPGDVKEGDETTITTWNNTNTEVMWVFEKTDKNSKRHKAE